MTAVQWLSLAVLSAGGVCAILQHSVIELRRRVDDLERSVGALTGHLASVDNVLLRHDESIDRHFAAHRAPKIGQR